MSKQPTESTAPKVYAAINAITAIMASEGIAKSNKNQQQGYAFRGIDDVYRVMSRALADHKLCILPRVLSREVTEKATRNGGTLIYTCLDVEYDFVSSEDGSTHTIRVVGEAMDSADKSSNKAMSAAYKYACLQAFCIPTEGDNDADATTHDVAQPQQQRNGSQAKTYLTVGQVEKTFATLQENGWTSEEMKMLLKNYEGDSVKARLKRVEAKHLGPMMKKINSGDEHAKITEQVARVSAAVQDAQTTDDGLPFK